ncbi:MAG: hypothetical protein ACXAC5_02790 [Promethearchaeota archaeon]
MARNNLREKLGDNWDEYQRLRKNLKALRYKLKNVEWVINWRRRTKKLLIEYKGGKCERCGFDHDIPAAYDFHHRDPASKDFIIGGTTRSLKRLKEEADKCELLCKICHAVEHADNIAPNRQKTAQRYAKQIQDTEEALNRILNY